MKLLFRLFISLCFFFYSGYGYLHTYQPSQQYASISSVKLLSQILQANYSDQQLQPRVVRSVPFFAEKDKMYAPDFEDDDTELISVKKWAQTAIELPAPFYASAAAHAPPVAAKRVVFREHYCYTSSSRYILFRVFRV